MSSEPDTRPHLVLLGGGHTHALFLCHWADRPHPAARVTLISDRTTSPYSGLLPGLLAGHYDVEQAHIDLPALCQKAGADFQQGTVTGLDTAGQRVHLADAEPRPYDLLSIDTGITPDTGVPGSAEHATPLKPVSQLTARWQACLTQWRHTPPRQVVMVGGGAAGTETLLAIRHALTQRGYRDVRYHLVTRDTALLTGHNPRVRRRLARHCANRGIRLHCHRAVTRVTEHAVHLDNGESLDADAVFWAAGGVPAAWPRDSGLAVTDDGFIRTDGYLRSVSHPGIFACGDIAQIDGHPTPRAGVFAVRQARPLFRNLSAQLAGRAGLLKPYTPQKHFLSLISLGERNAVASRGCLSAHGRWVWRWKDRIDRRFMARFPSPPAGQPGTGHL